MKVSVRVEQSGSAGERTGRKWRLEGGTEPCTNDKVWSTVRATRGGHEWLSCNELSNMDVGVSTEGVGKEKENLRRFLELPRIK